MRDVLEIVADGRIDTLLAVAFAFVACTAPPTPAPRPDPVLPPAAVRTAPAVDVAASAVHRVRPGDTLSDIAKSYAVDVDQLVQANQLPDADHIVSGQDLQIPASSARSARAEALVEQAADLYRNARFEDALERVQQAETLFAARDSASEDDPQLALGARAAFITGCSLAAFGENERAVAAFSRVRALDPGFEPPEGWLSPRLEKLYLDAQ